jgi:hypothetical protein
LSVELEVAGDELGDELVVALLLLLRRTAVRTGLKEIVGCGSRGESVTSNREKREERTVVFNDDHVVLDGESVDELLTLDRHRGAGRVLKDGDGVENGRAVEAVGRVSICDGRKGQTERKQGRREMRWKREKGKR